MQSSRPRLRLVTPKRSLKERSIVFWLLLAIPVLAGCALAMVQSDAVTHLADLPGELFDGLIAEVAEGWGRLRRS